MLAAAPLCPESPAKTPSVPPPVAPVPCTTLALDAQNPRSTQIPQSFPRSSHPLCIRSPAPDHPSCSCDNARAAYATTTLVSCRHSPPQLPVFEALDPSPTGMLP